MSIMAFTCGNWLRLYLAGPPEPAQHVSLIDYYYIEFMIIE